MADTGQLPHPFMQKHPGGNEGGMLFATTPPGLHLFRDNLDFEQQPILAGRSTFVGAEPQNLWWVPGAWRWGMNQAWDGSWVGLGGKGSADDDEHRALVQQRGR